MTRHHHQPCPACGYLASVRLRPGVAACLWCGTEFIDQPADQGSEHTTPSRTRRVLRHFIDAERDRFYERLSR